MPLRLRFISASLSVLLFLIPALSWSAADKRLLIVAGDLDHLAPKLEMLTEIGAAHGFAVHRRYIAQITEDEFPRLFDGYDAVVLDTVRKEVARAVRGKVRYDGTAPVLELYGNPNLNSVVTGISEGPAERLRQYYVNGGRKNFAGFFRYLRALLSATPAEDIPPPVVIPEHGVYHPRHEARVLSRTEDYLAWRKVDLGRKPPVIGVAVARNSIVLEQTDPIDALVTRIEAQGAVPLVFYYPDHPDGVTKMVTLNGRPIVDVLIHFYALHNPMDRKKEFERLGVPVLGALTYRWGTVADWEKDPAGIPIMSVPSSLAVPEFAGVTDPLMVAVVESRKDGRTATIGYQMDALVRKAMNLVKLQRKANQDKKVAFLFYNFPPGEKNIRAYFMNVPRSLAEVLKGMKAKGYAVETPDEAALTRDTTALLRPLYRDGALQELLDKDLADLLPVEAYRSWFTRLPEPVQKEVTTRWGKPEQSSMTLERSNRRYFVIPRLKAGNIIILPQPPRGERLDDREKALYHDTKWPLNHFYMAAYLYARDAFGADALVHFGTHGTQEWTPGKERGLSIYDYPYLLLGDLPVVYPYIMDNVGEALQAMRRGRAVLVSHQTPPFAPAGLPKDLVPLKDLIHQYSQLDDGAVKDKTRRDITAVVVKGNHNKDMGWETSAIEADFERFLEALHEHLHDLAQQAQPLGLHTFGRSPETSHRLFTVMLMLGEEFYRRVLGDEARELFFADYARLTASEPYRLLERHLVDGEPIESIQDGELRRLVMKGKEYFDKLAAEGEIAGLLAALDGKYVSSAAGGDPIRSPDALPTGRNLYGFDPAKIPTKQAFEAGKEGVESLIRDYQAKHKRYPEKLAFVLWSVETVRSQGVLEAQALYALGVRPVWDEAGRVVGTEVIPAAELGRPRIDVVLSSSSSHRDMFPNVLQHLSDAVKKVTALDEPGNPVRAHTQRVAAVLKDQGMAAEAIEQLALARIFTPESGQYPIGLDDATLASDTWEKDDKLASLYLTKMGYIWAPGTEFHSTRLAADLYAENLKAVDATILARSSNVFGLLDSDDPFQYLGGISLAVRNLTGKSPELYIANLRNPSKGKTETTAQFLATELRTRYFHPNWIKAMQQEGYSGTVEMLDTINNFWGWQVMASEVVRADQWQEFHEVYVKDKYELGLREWFEKANPQALAQIAERMLEAVRKDYWKADGLIVKELVTLYQNLAAAHNVVSPNKKFQAFLDQKLAGFGLAPGRAQEPAAAAPPQQGVSVPDQPAQSVPDQPAQTVQGLRLQKIDAQKPEESHREIYLLLLIALATVAGALRQTNGQRVMLRARGATALTSVQTEEKRTK